MTIRRRLLISNILMILVPAAVAMLIGGACLGLLLVELLYGPELTRHQWKLAIGACALVIGGAIVLAIWLTNRFVTRFVFRRIQEPLEMLTQGMCQLRDGNLDYRVGYPWQDEFTPVFQDFNDMAWRLQTSVRQLQSQERSRKALIAGISHDIRSPLTSIQAYVEGLLDGVARTPEAQKKYLTTIQTKVRDLDHIVTQLFLFSKMELEEQGQDCAPLRLDEALREIAGELGEDLKTRGLSLELSLEPAVIRGDPVQLRRIVSNIAENSLKYKKAPQGKLCVQLRREAGKVLLRFYDDGPGVPEEALPHLFDLFYRADPARANPGSGSGLGLAIVAGAVKNSGGQVRALNGPLGGLEIQMEWEEYGGENSDCGR